jgi:hypothetical protein
MAGANPFGLLADLSENQDPNQFGKTRAKAQAPTPVRKVIQVNSKPHPVLIYSCANERITTPYDPKVLADQHFLVIIRHANECLKGCSGDGFRMADIVPPSNWQVIGKN